MASIGYVLSSEQFLVSQLVEYAVLAEQAGFDAVWTRDHFQPWQARGTRVRPG
jgi:coenzyme F420-dependent glucose-6-phosphate dehydrogenase